MIDTICYINDRNSLKTLDLWSWYSVSKIYVNVEVNLNGLSKVLYVWK